MKSLLVVLASLAFVSSITGCYAQGSSASAPRFAEDPARTEREFVAETRIAHAEIRPSEQSDGQVHFSEASRVGNSAAIPR
jgi:hypothetical protein